MLDPNDCCSQLVVDKNYDNARGPTDKQPDESPFETNMRKELEKRVGPATSPQAGMGDTMSKTPPPGDE